MWLSATFWTTDILLSLVAANASVNRTSLSLLLHWSEPGTCAQIERWCSPWLYFLKKQIISALTLADENPIVHGIYLSVSVSLPALSLYPTQSYLKHSLTFISISLRICIIMISRIIKTFLMYKISVRPLTMKKITKIFVNEIFEMWKFPHTVYAWSTNLSSVMRKIF